jgi:mannose-6-phosphate isomerase-like protein (cupin superfamily)
MKNPSRQLVCTAILAVAAMGVGATSIVKAQSHGSEFPVPQGAPPQNHTVPSGDVPGALVAGGGTLGAARAIPFDQMTARTNASGGESRNVARGTLATGESVNIHQSMQVAGQTPPPLHVIQHSEFILVREGEIEFDHEVAGQIVTEKAGPGSVVYVAFGTRHAIKDAGSVPARYFVVAIGGDAK